MAGPARWGRRTTVMAVEEGQRSCGGWGGRGHLLSGGVHAGVMENIIIVIFLLFYRSTYSASSSRFFIDVANATSFLASSSSSSSACLWDDPDAADDDSRHWRCPSFLLLVVVPPRSNSCRPSPVHILFVRSRRWLVVVCPSVLSEQASGYPAIVLCVMSHYWPQCGQLQT